MKLQFLGATETVTGSKYLLNEEGKKILVDCGLFQGIKELRLRNWEPFTVQPSEIDAVVLTHAHLDHSGYLPLLVRQGFKGPIYATKATCDLVTILLKDAGRIQEEDAARANRYGYSKHKPAEPLYTEQDAIQSLRLLSPIEFGEDYPISADLVFNAKRAGHILGSAFITFRSPQTTIVFSGDLGRPNSFIMKDPATIQTADYLIMESTYGGKEHTKDDPFEQLGSVIRKTVKQGGSVIIPCFAVGRAQTIMYILEQLKERNQLPKVPIYLDSPMAVDATEIMERNMSEHKLPKKLCRDVCAVAEYVSTVDQSKAIDMDPSPKIIISASGMLEGGRVLHHLKRYAPDPKSAIVFTGFQAPMTRGARILSGEKEVKVHGELVPVRAHIEALESLSSHADMKESLDWLRGFTKMPSKIFLTHGEKESSEALKKRIEEEFDVDVYIPKYLEEVEL
ncbi:MBL fold metallo-hydrolase RNA specificity domain-containing protein [Estrella lausannensis]|uniref:MBL fold metallo-hydrolase n=1 Tax=Estrella lausannensis TaxID=483423 RepID=A0A0H5DP37_9BACT|nr:MBL fold metallo-hydrolase [Estrella lausannensis]CRX38246.1 hypothetical protein ELAC_0897 [Estrella lausannensis]